MFSLIKKYPKISFQEILIILSICLTPILGIYEVSDILNINLFAFIPNKTIIKSSKDLFIVLIILIGMVFGFWRVLKMSIKLYIVLISTIIISIFVSLLNVPFEAILSGIRWLLPFFLYLFIGKLRTEFYIKLTNCLEIIILAGLILQFYQLFNMNGIYGLSIGGFSIRNPGFYLIPSSMSAYAMTTLFFIHNFEASTNKRTFYFFVVSFSIFLTASGSGILSLILYLLFLISKKINPFFIFFVFSLFFTFLLGLLPLITGREDIIDSPIGRINIFIENIGLDKLIFSTKFGTATNTFINLRPDLLESQFAIIADSMINSSVINCGLLFLIIIFYLFFIKPLYNFGRIGFLFLIINLPFFLSIVLFELYPVNILFFIELISLKVIFQNEKVINKIS